MARPSLDEIFGSTQTAVRPSLDEIFGTQKPKPQFATMDEARAAMANADYNLKQAQAEADGGYIETGIHDFERNWYNSLFAGIPDIMSRKLSNRPFIKPGTENIPAQIAGTIVGPGAIGTGVTNLLGRGATSTLAKIGAGAAGGAVSGALTAPSDGTDATARTVQGVLGAGIGAAVPAAGALIKQGAKTYKDFKEVYKLNKSLPGAKELESSIDGLRNTRDIMNANQQKMSISTSMTKDEVAKQIADTRSSFQKSITDISKAFKNTKENINNLVSVKSGEVAKNVKQPVINLFRNASKAYGSSLDEILNSIDSPVEIGSVIKQNATPVTRSELLAQIRPLLDEFADDASIVNSDSYKQLVKFAAKYSSEGADTGLVDVAGQAIKQQLPESIDFKQLIGDVKEYNKVFSSSFSSGAKSLSPDELIAAKFNYNMGNIIKERVPKFAELQSSYKPIIDSKTLAYRVFKPGSELSSNSSQALFKRIATGKATQQDKDLVRVIQEGFTVGGKKVEGIGYVTKELDDISNQLASLGKKFNISKDVLKANTELDINKLKDISSGLVKNLRQSKLKNIDEVIAMDNRLSELQKLLSQRKSIDEIKFKALLKTAGAVGAGGALTLLGSRKKVLGE